MHTVLLCVEESLFGRVQSTEGVKADETQPQQKRSGRG